MAGRRVTAGGWRQAGGGQAAGVQAGGGQAGGGRRVAGRRVAGRRVAGRRVAGRRVVGRRGGGRRVAGRRQACSGRECGCGAPLLHRVRASAHLSQNDGVSWSASVARDTRRMRRSARALGQRSLELGGRGLVDEARHCWLRKCRHCGISTREGPRSPRSLLNIERPQSVDESLNR